MLFLPLLFVAFSNASDGRLAIEFVRTGMFFLRAGLFTPNQE
jgi:hypothetical protein